MDKLVLLKTNEETVCTRGLFLASRATQNLGALRYGMGIPVGMDQNQSKVSVSTR